MKIIHGVFTNDKNKGDSYIKQLVKNRNVDDENVYLLFGFAEHQLGTRVNYAHIDKICLNMEHGKDILYNSIKPCITPHKNVEDKIFYW